MSREKWGKMKISYFSEAFQVYQGCTCTMLKLHRVCEWALKGEVHTGDRSTGSIGGYA